MQYWVLGLVLLAVGSLMPFELYGIDTVVHFIMYAVLSFIPISLFSRRRTAFLVAIAMSPLGYLLEVLNMIVTFGSFNAYNALANNLGILAGIATGFIVRLKLHYEPQRDEDENRQ